MYYALAGEKEKADLDEEFVMKTIFILFRRVKIVERTKLKISVSLILTLGIFLTGCAERRFEESKNINSAIQSEQMKELNDDNSEDEVNDKDINKVDIAYYVNLIEGTMASEKFLGTLVPMGVDGIRDTVFYMDSDTGKIYFVPEGSERCFILTTLNHYEKPAISETTISDKATLVCIGNAEINYDVEPSHSLPDLTEDDKRILNEICDYLYDELSFAMNKFTFDVYLGDFIRGYDDREYIMVDFAIVGDKNYLRWVELTEQQDGYKVWLYPPLFYYDSEKTIPVKEVEGDYKYISNIVSLDYLMGHLEK